MGAIFAKHILQKPQPTIGLMNVGSEEAKGHDLAKDTHALFKSSHLSGQFIGNVEGRDINKGTSDVIVTDGYVGNIVLKVCEGVFEFVMKMAGKELLTSLNTEKHLGQQALHNLIKRYDYHEHGGAPLLGIDGICIVCHGSSSDRAIANAVSVAAKYARAKLNALIVKELEESPGVGDGEE
jgi:glycerol-3-phosphate acyltransferase PlsX